MRTGVLVIIFFAILVYMTVGVYVFNALEADFEIQRQKNLLKALHLFLDRHRCIDHEGLRDLLDYINRDMDTARYVLHHNETMNVMWDYVGAASFVLSVISTIGYGHITPKTPYGRIACMVYAFIGIPLLLVFMAGVGERLCMLSERCLQCHRRCSSSQVFHKINVLLLGLLGLVVIFVIPTVFNMQMEDWTALDSMYYSVISLTTIGFGDLVAGNPVNRDSLNYIVAGGVFRVVCLLWTLFGLSYISMIITAITRYYVRSTGTVERKVQVKMKKLMRRVNQRLTFSTSSTATQTATDLGDFFTVPVNTMHDGDLADMVSSEAVVPLVRFSAIHDELPWTDEQQATGVPVHELRRPGPKACVKAPSDSCVKSGVDNKISLCCKSPVKKSNVQKLRKASYSPTAETCLDSPSSDRHLRGECAVPFREEPPPNSISVEDLVVDGSFVKSAGHNGDDIKDPINSTRDSSTNAACSDELVLETAEKVRVDDFPGEVSDECRTDDKR